MFKPSFYRRYVDIFLLFESPASAHSIRECMSSKNQNINFTVEQENIGSLSFLDVKICSKNGKFVTSVYRKPTFSGVFTDYESFIPTYQKRGLLQHYFIGVLAYVVIKNNYLSNFIDSCIKSFANKLYTPKVMVPNVPKRNAFFSSCPSWEVLRFKFQRSFKNYLVIN